MTGSIARVDVHVTSELSNLRGQFSFFKWIVSATLNAAIFGVVGIAWAAGSLTSKVGEVERRIDRVENRLERIETGINRLVDLKSVPDTLFLTAKHDTPH